MLYISRNAPYKRTGDEVCMTMADRSVRQMAYKTKRMFFIRCVSDMYNDHAEGIEVDTIPRKLEEQS